MTTELLRQRWLRVRRPLIVFASTAWLIIAAGAVARAQDSRAALIAEEQAAKATQLHPYEPSRVEEIVTRVGSGLLAPRGGFYPLIDTAYSGGSLTLGVGYRRLYGERSWWDFNALYSIRNYKLFELSTNSPGHLAGKLDLSARAGWRDATQVGYYGLGTANSIDDRANYRMQQAFAGAGARYRPVRLIRFGADAAFEDYALLQGQGSQPSIEQVYSPDEAPGLGSSPSYLHTTALAAIDSRPSAGYARSGTNLEVRYQNYYNSKGLYTFDRLEGEAIQHVPILRETWVMSFRGLVQTTLGDDAVPYFLFPSLGSGRTLRAYKSFRFRDYHGILVQGELRWIPNRYGMDMALFYDAGKVTSVRSELDLTHLKSDVGIGVRFHGPTLTPLRVEIAHGNEGWHIVFASTPVF